MKGTKNLFKSICLFYFVIILFIVKAKSQSVGISESAFVPDSSAILEIRSNQKGLLIPRITQTQRDAINNPAHSLIIFNTTANCFQWWDALGQQWVNLSCGCQDPGEPYATMALNIYESQFMATWLPGTSATGYYLDVALDSNFTSYVVGYQNLDVGNTTGHVVSGLTCNTTYYYRLRSYNTCGTSGYSNVIKVTTAACGYSCFGKLWILVNMNVGTMIYDPAEQNDDNQIEKYCYNNISSNCAVYGGLYQWAEAIQASYNANNNSYTGNWATCDPCGSDGRQGICPSDYHIPTDLEFSRYEWCIQTMIGPTNNSHDLVYFQTSYGWRGANNAAGPGHKMKVTSNHTPSWDGSNASGFSALPAGNRNQNSGFNHIGNTACFWTSTEIQPTDAWYRFLLSNEFQSIRAIASKTAGFSVRCLQD